MTQRPRLLLGLALTTVIPLGTVGCSSDDDVTTGGTLPTLQADGKATPGRRYVAKFGTHCGVERLGLAVNEVFWITDEAKGTATDWMPAEWAEAADRGLIPLEIVLSSNGTELRAEASGRTVTYRPIESSDPEKLCE